MDAARPAWYPPPALLRAAAIAACGLVIAAAAVGLAQLASQLTLVLAPVVVAIFLTRALSVPAEALARRGWPPALRAATVLVGFLAALAVVAAGVAPPFARELEGLGPTVEDGLSQVEDWIVRDAPFEVTRTDLERVRKETGDRIASDAAGDQPIATGAQLAVEVLAGSLLALILTFFGLKDGRTMQTWALGHVPAARHRHARAMAAAAWAALGGYLRGAALLGVVEAVVIGVAVAAVGADLVVPIMVITFLAAFVPLVGAVVAGAAAVLVTLASAGVGPALVVLAVAVLVQQLDNDLLAPWIYGHALALHPVVILLSITAGTALFGFAGTVLAVPAVAIATAANTARRATTDRADADEPA